MATERIRLISSARTQITNSKISTEQAKKKIASTRVLIKDSNSLVAKKKR